MTQTPMRLVPAEPTEEMTLTVAKASGEGGMKTAIIAGWLKRDYTALLAASPNEGQVSRGTVAELEIVLETMGSCAGMTNKMLVKMLLKHLGLQIKGEN